MWDLVGWWGSISVSTEWEQRLVPPTFTGQLSECSKSHVIKWFVMQVIYFSTTLDVSHCNTAQIHYWCEPQKILNILNPFSETQRMWINIYIPIKESIAKFQIITPINSFLVKKKSQLAYNVDFLSFFNSPTHISPNPSLTSLVLFSISIHWALLRGRVLHKSLM